MYSLILPVDICLWPMKWPFFLDVAIIADCIRSRRCLWNTKSPIVVCKKNHHHFDIKTVTLSILANFNIISTIYISTTSEKISMCIQKLCWVGSLLFSIRVNLTLFHLWKPFAITYEVFYCRSVCRFFIQESILIKFCIQWYKQTLLLNERTEIIISHYIQKQMTCSIKLCYSLFMNICVIKPYYFLLLMPTRVVDWNKFYKVAKLIFST